MVTVAPLKYGVIFKKAFSKPHIFMAFVKDITGVEIKIDKVETEKSFLPTVGSVDVHFDLFAEDKENRIIVDIQHKRYSDHYDRFLHYHNVALIEQIKSSANYKPNMQVYTIVVLTSGDKHRKDILITDFRPRDLDGNPVDEIEHKIFFICPKYVSNKTPKPYREWLKAIEDSLDKKMDRDEYKNDNIQEIIGFIEADKVTPQERARMIDEYSDEEYLKDEREKAKKERDREIAKNLLDVLDIETIALKTGLSIEEIEKMKI